MEKEREMSEPTSKFVHVPTNTLTQPHMRTEGCTHLYGCTSTQVHTHSCTHTHLTRVSVQRPLVLKMKRMSERERERESVCVCVCVEWGIQLCRVPRWPLCQGPDLGNAPSGAGPLPAGGLGLRSHSPLSCPGVC